MKLNKEEKEYLIKLLKEKSKKSISEDIEIFNVANALVCNIHKNNKIWEIKDYPKKKKMAEKIIKKYYLSERRKAKGILEKVKNE